MCQLGLMALASAGCSDGTTAPASFKPAAHAQFPVLKFNGGPVLSSMRMVVIVPSNHDRTDSLFAFAKALPTSSWASTVGQPYGFTIRPDVRTVTGPPVTDTAVTPAQLRDYVGLVRQSAPDLAPDGQTLYVIFEPAGVTLSAPFCGFHFGYDSAGDGLAAITTCKVAEPPLSSLTVLASHEIAEAASDPVISSWYIPKNFNQPWVTTPWALDDGTAGAEENGDLCTGTRWVEAGFTYQRIWSNAAAAAGGDPCIPAVSVPYYNVSGAAEWYAAESGTAHIALTGWSTSPIEDWILSAGAVAPNITPTISFNSADSIVINSRTTYRAVNNGSVATMNVSFPAGASHFSYVVIRVISQRLNAAKTGLRDGEDVAHSWAVGVYIP